VLRAFHACAASQGCTNNLTFGAGGKDADGRAVAGWGYYEVHLCVLFLCCAGVDWPRRRSREVQEQAQIGTERRGSTRT